MNKINSLEGIFQWMLSTWEEIKLVYTSHHSQKLISDGLKILY